MKYRIGTIALLFLAQMASAEDKSLGCGLGQMAAPKKTWVSLTTRAVVDYLVPSQTSAMTTGTSGCEAHSIVKQEKRAIHYAEANYDSLELEMAQGQGESLSTLAKVLGCQDETVPSFSRAAQKNFERVVPANERNPARMLHNIQNMIQTSPTLAAGCNLEVI